MFSQEETYEVYYFDAWLPGRVDLITCILEYAGAKYENLFPVSTSPHI